MYSARLVSVLNEIAHRYAGLTHKSIVDVLSQPRYSNTGAGVRSVKVDVVSGNDAKSPALHITFDDHLIVLNKGKIEWTRLPDIEKLTEWAKTKKSSDKEAEQLAWAVAWDKKKNDTWSPKLWRKKSLSQVLKDMNEQLLKDYHEAIKADQVDATKGK
jgi:hypothetical protein